MTQKVSCVGNYVNNSLPLYLFDIWSLTILKMLLHAYVIVIQAVALEHAPTAFICLNLVLILHSTGQKLGPTH